MYQVKQSSHISTISNDLKWQVVNLEKDFHTNYAKTSQEYTVSKIIQSKYE